MHNDKSIQLTCSAHALAAAAQIAPDYALPIDEVAQLVDKLMIIKLPDSVDHPLLERAEKLRVLLADISPALARLQELALNMRELVDHPDSSTLSLATVAAATINCELEAVMDIKNGLHDAMLLVARQEVLNPRTALVEAMLATCGRFWLDLTENYPTGQFRLTPAGLQPDQGSGLEFAVRVLLAAQITLDSSEISASVPAMNAATGMDQYYDELREGEESKAATRAKLRLVK